jgi:hypothetical protein
VSRLVPVHNPHPGGTYIWFTVPGEPGPDPGRAEAACLAAAVPEPEMEIEP